MGSMWWAVTGLRKYPIVSFALVTTAAFSIIMLAMMLPARAALLDVPEVYVPSYYEIGQKITPDTPCRSSYDDYQGSKTSNCTQSDDTGLRFFVEFEVGDGTVTYVSKWTSDYDLKL